MKKNLGIIALCICVATCLFAHRSVHDLPQTEQSKVSVFTLTQDNNNILSFISSVINNFNSEATLLNVNKPIGTSRAKSHQQRLLQQAVCFNMSTLSYFHSKINQSILLYDAFSLWGRALLSFIRILQV
jgi:hypothetical protein